MGPVTRYQADYECDECRARVTLHVDCLPAAQIRRVHRDRVIGPDGEDELCPAPGMLLVGTTELEGEE